MLKLGVASVALRGYLRLFEVTAGYMRVAEAFALRFTIEKMELSLFFAYSLFPAPRPCPTMAAIVVLDIVFVCVRGEMPPYLAFEGTRVKSGLESTEEAYRG